MRGRCLCQEDICRAVALSLEPLSNIPMRQGGRSIQVHGPSTAGYPAAAFPPIDSSVHVGMAKPTFMGVITTGSSARLSRSRLDAGAWPRVLEHPRRRSRPPHWLAPATTIRAPHATLLLDPLPPVVVQNTTTRVVDAASGRRCLCYFLPCDEEGEIESLLREAHRIQVRPC